MTTFDEILPRVAEVLRADEAQRSRIGKMIINRDLNGRVRLIVGETARAHAQVLAAIAKTLQERLGPHAYPADSAVLFEEDLELVRADAPGFPLEGLDDVLVIDRLATESSWLSIAPKTEGAPRIVFFSIKGGVGRSTALATCAWALAEAGKRVLVLDLDLESPGLSSALLPEDRRPKYGIADWLVEDLVENGDAVFGDLIALSPLSRDGEIHVVPAHGNDPGEYVAKLGRVWMPKTTRDGSRQAWSQRLGRLVHDLEAHLHPDVILLDSRAGIDEVAASCVTDLGAGLILLFAIDGDQTWSGYRVLFGHWNRAGKAVDIRERLQLVGAMIPDDESRVDYFDGLRERAWDMFTTELYDAIPPGESVAGRFSFDEHDASAPHYPWPIRWNRGFAALRSLHTRLAGIDAQEARAVFGPLLEGVQTAIPGKAQGND